MKMSLSAVLFVAAMLGFSAGCKKEATVDEAAERIRAYAERSNPELRDQPLLVTLSRKKGGGVCACIKVCSASGKCTPCSCSPPACGSCASAAEVAPVDSIFNAAQ